ncbi:MAG TPA: PLP-dependent aminotransferase family protein [Acidiphilium sp.]|nr:MAG: 2-aminoadipate aminotransferase [Acidiphilium sp. 21-60-14]OYV90857.1 MAG: 2-aminoadipate aminotransferase [Acidiphilium sp. 37-60-79]OZB38750.1 MAG: 2-aminoadipate aminotransferase [Acidiphilium sp. 34-60-192]HQT86931.1 PLP-dependent aminotransferase family protein [Acidiphilium sp.]HQU24073.1 PLP-dependent aminotransferase family protein [Acidiphilium sp.]
MDVNNQRKRAAPPQRIERQWAQLFALNIENGTTLQMQVRQGFVAAILDRRLPAGAKLPSSRLLARQLDIARNTVNAAYRQLADEGFIRARPRSGYVVRAAIVDRASAATPHRPAPGLADGPRWPARIGSRFSSLRNISKPSDWYRYPYQFIYGQPDPALFPTADWRECSRAALAVLAIRDWSSDMIDGDDAALIEQIQLHVLPQRGIYVTPDQIMITVGTQHALYLLAELLVSARSVVGVEEPGYPDARNIFAVRGAALRPLPVGPEGIDSADLAGCDLAFVTPSHQCPTASTMSWARRREVMAYADRHDLILIEDDYESELTFAGALRPALKSLDTAGRVVYVSSFSKTLAPGLRLGYMVGAPALIAEARVLRRLMLRHPPANNQRAAALFIALGHNSAQLRRIKTHLADRAGALVDALVHHAPMLTFKKPHGGSSIWIKGPAGLDAASLAKAAEQRGVLIEPGDVFFQQPNAPCPFFRLGYSSISTDKISAGVQRLATLLDP